MKQFKWTSRPFQKYINVHFQITLVNSEISDHFENELILPLLLKKTF